ncbi:uncharacterized protein AB675_10393 [Cyphellophora attinorum]|uniref:EthD domain-containing protein n=1 Tax=Cyphellophora attinorum TaxID=1664694 RepID=A0A0N1H0V5_9EURO|nr:uncharacterized protein AB675_10393 [Phialophora attinorum]KPI37497.1 hypothetical protein AB675_10393 [Phialophora attinorum]
MTYNVIVLYPNNDDSKFDLKYYLDTHMPLVQSSWKTDGLESWKVNEFKPGPDGSKPQYSIGATLTFTSQDHAGKAMTGEKAPKIFGDIPNFTNSQPILIAGEQVGSS